MGRREDLEKNIRESYQLIHQYEEMLILSSDPKEQARARSNIEGQRGFIKGHLEEYVRLSRCLNLTMPDDITGIAVTVNDSFTSVPPTQPPPRVATQPGRDCNVTQAEG